MIDQLKHFAIILKNSLKLLRRTEPLILSSSTAFFTTFSLSPILLLLVNLFSLYFKSDSISSQLFAKIGTDVGIEAAAEIELIVNNFMEFETTWWMTILGILFFIFVSTTLLGVIKQNIHKLWHIRKVSRNIKYQFQERSIMAIIILLTGILIFLSILMDSALAISLDFLQSRLPLAGIFIVRILNIIFSIMVVSAWFTLIFKLLPQAQVDWNVAFTGAFLTAVLFNAGKFALGKILIHARIASIFGASASFALLLLFIFYGSFILYFGAAFTHEFAESHNKHISAGMNAIEYEEKLIGTED